MKRLRFKLIQWGLRVFTLPLSIRIPEKVSLSSGNGTGRGFFVFSRLPTKTLLRSGLIRAYQQIFSQPPWEENWSEEKVLAKIEREIRIRGRSFLVLMAGTKEWPVAGFSWGAIVPLSAVEKRIASALGVDPKGLVEDILRERRVKELVYFDELAILPSFRGGLEPLRGLVRPGLELGYAQGIKQTLFWSTPESKIVPLVLGMGYEPLPISITRGEKKIIFLFNPNFIPLLKILQRFGGKKIAKILRIVSRIFG